MTLASSSTTVPDVSPGGRDDDPPNANAIDFRELRRSMRRAARGKRRDGGGGGKNGDRNDYGGATIAGDGGDDDGAGAGAAAENDDCGGGDGDAPTPLPPVLDSSWSSSSSSKPDDVLRRYRVGRIDHVHYVSRFLNPEYVNDVLLPWLLGRPDVIDDDDDESNNNMSWKTLRHARRRVMLVDATVERMPVALRGVVDALVESGFFPSLSDCPEPNHVLINEYRPGEGILPHTDGPAYHPRTATISISVGDKGGCDSRRNDVDDDDDDDDDASPTSSSTVTGVLFKFRPRLTADEIGGDDGNRSDDVVMEVMLAGHGSLVVFSDDAYSNHCHSIDEVTTEVATDGLCANCDGGTVIVRAGRRISLTFRHKYAA